MPQKRDKNVYFSACIIGGCPVRIEFSSAQVVDSEFGLLARL
jgi:hypothetical protein